MKARIPNYDFFEVNLVNYLGYHIVESNCLVLFDSNANKVFLVEPMWFNDVNKPFIKLFIGKEFGTRDSLLNFLAEMNELMEIGSLYKFKLTSFTNDSILYDLTYSRGDTYTVKGNGTSSTTRKLDDGVERKIKIDIKNFSIVQYASVNPYGKDTLMINKDTEIFLERKLMDVYDTIPAPKQQL